MRRLLLFVAVVIVSVVADNEQEREQRRGLVNEALEWTTFRARDAARDEFVQDPDWFGNDQQMATKGPKGTNGSKSASSKVPKGSKGPKASTEPKGSKAPKGTNGPKGRPTYAPYSPEHYSPVMHSPVKYSPIMHPNPTPAPYAPPSECPEIDFECDIDGGSDECSLHSTCKPACVPQFCLLPENDPHKIKGHGPQLGEHYVKLGTICAYFHYVDGETHPRHDVKVCCERINPDPSLLFPFDAECSGCNQCDWPQKVNDACCKISFEPFYDFGRDGNYHPACPGQECCKCGENSFTCIDIGTSCDTSSCSGDDTIMAAEEMSKTTSQETSTTTQETSTTAQETSTATSNIASIVTTTTTNCVESGGIPPGNVCMRGDTCCTDELGNPTVCLDLEPDSSGMGTCRAGCAFKQDDSSSEAFCVALCNKYVCPGICREVCPPCPDGYVFMPDGDFDSECSQNIVADPPARGCPANVPYCCGCDCNSVCIEDVAGGFVPPS